MTLSTVIKANIHQPETWEKSNANMIIGNIVEILILKYIKFNTENTVAVVCAVQELKKPECCFEDVS